MGRSTLLRGLQQTVNMASGQISLLLHILMAPQEGMMARLADASSAMKL